MKKPFALTALLMALSVMLTGCEKTESDGSNYSFDYAMVGHPESLDPQFAVDECSLTVIGNIYTGLVETDESGTIKNAAALDYTVSEDGLTYSFRLRDNCYWFYDEDKDETVSDDECKPVTAYDFEFAFRRIFNPETCSPHREKYLCLKNAQSIINGNTDYTQIGVHALSDTELVFELDYECGDFLNLLSLTPAMPCNEEFFYSTKGRYGLDDESVMSDGAFFIRQWFYDPYGNDNFIYMQRNLANTEYDRIYPTAVNFYMKDGFSEAQSAFDTGESDVLLSFTCTDKIKEENNVKMYRNYTVGIISNPDNPRYSNMNIKKALAYGIDKESFDGQISEDASKAYGIIPPGITVEGKSYRELVPERNAYISSDDSKTVEYNPQLAVSYYENGMKQMNLQSLENIKLLVPENLMDIEYLHLVTQNWQSLFGFYIGIEEVPEEEFYSRIAEKDFTLAVYPITGAYNSPVSVIEQFSTDKNKFGYSNPQIDLIFDSLNKINDFSENTDAILEAEKLILDTFDFIPVFYKSEYLIMGSGNDDILYDPFTKQIDFRHAKYFE
ncbi:MAG: peptide ABC transporter substrate-binding protein [Ruminococcus sp.]|nr:peptide ABC transporter substrate-binding protein [Ruminococcus sp.]